MRILLNHNARHLGEFVHLGGLTLMEVIEHSKAGWKLHRLLSVTYIKFLASIYQLVHYVT